jgi:hypothetical protein
VVAAGVAATVLNLRVVSSMADLPGGLLFSGSGTVVSDLGLTGAPNHILPISSLGTTGSLAVNPVAVWTGSSAEVGVQVAEKILVTTSNGSQARWFVVGTTDAEAPGWGWREATPTQVRGTVANPTGFASGDTALVTVGATTFTFSSTAGNLVDFVAQLNAEFDSSNVPAVAEIRSQGPDSYLQVTNYEGTSLVFVDSANTAFANAGMSTTTTFYGSTQGSVPNPSFTAGDSFTITVGSAVASITVSGPSIDDVILDINSDPTVGLTGLIVASKVNVGGSEFLQISSSNNTFFTLRNNTGFADPVPPLAKAGIITGVTHGNTLVYQGYSVNVPQPKDLSQLAAGNIWVNTVAGNRGAAWSVRRYNAGLASWPTVSAPLYENDTVANAGYGVNRTPGSIYVRFNSLGSTPANATFQVRAWNGTSWEPAAGLVLSGNSIPYAQSFEEPTGSPVQGSVWFNQDLKVDIMVSNGQIWMGYRNMYPETDPSGAILSATQPSVQSDNTPLEDNDLWIDTSDLENYPKIYRYDSLNVSWELIDVSDQTSPQGILFSDARPNNNGTATGSEDIASMLVSNYVDPDAPSALAYPFGFLLFNTRYSTNNVKEWRPNYLSSGVYRDRWVTASGNDFDGSPLMGRRAQRIMVVRAMASAVVTNQDLRAEGNFFNLLAAPGYPELTDELLTLNTDKKDVGFVVVDAPARLTPDGTSVQAWSNNSNNAPSNGEVGMITASRYMAVYYPWGLATNLDGTEVFVPPSTAVLRTYAFNDQVSYPWFAPAGFNRGLVTAFTSVGYLNSESEYVPVQLSQGQRDVLYVNKINPIAFIPGRGLVIYGQKTRSPVESALDRVNVARLVNFLNYQLDNLAKPFLFEPNDQFTRDAVQRTFESFFGDLVALRAVFDYAVLCNETNNPPERIDRNELWIDIAIKPIKSVEFILIPLRILNTGDPLPT